MSDDEADGMPYDKVDALNNDAPPQVEYIDVVYMVTLTVMEPEIDDGLDNKIPSVEEVKMALYQHLGAVDSEDAILVEML